MTLAELFDADISGRDFPRGKPDPAIFLTAAQELGVDPGDCFVVEDATSGVQAAKAGGMAALGVARLDDRDLLVQAGADLVVPTLDDVSVAALGEGRLEERRVAAELRQRHTERPPSVWTLAYDGFDPGRQGLREALCAVGNGYFVTRGALPEAAADEVHYPGTYVAGLYNRAQTEIAGRTVENEDLVNVPNWLPLRFRIAGGPWFDVAAAEVLEHRLELDLRQGTLTRRLRFQDPDGRRTEVVQRRLVSMKDQHLAGLETTFTAENWSGTMQVRSGLDGRVVNAGVKRYRDLNGRHLRVLHAGEADAETLQLQAETNQSHVRVALAARTRLLRDGQAAQAERRLVDRTRVRRPRAGLRAGGGAAGDGGEGGRPLHLPGPGHLREPAGRPRGRAGGARLRRAAGPARRRVEHPLGPVRPGAGQRQRVGRDGPAPAHLPPAADRLAPHRPPGRWRPGAWLARGGLPGPHLLGRAVHLPVLQPPAAGPGRRAARLPPRPPPAARAAARQAGYEGAMFPWQSGSNGREETQQLHLNPKSGRWLPDHSHLQRHVNIAIAYNVWQHYHGHRQHRVPALRRAPSC